MSAPWVAHGRTRPEVYALARKNRGITSGMTQNLAEGWYS